MVKVTPVGPVSTTTENTPSKRYRRTDQREKGTNGGGQVRVMSSVRYDNFVGIN